MVLGWWWCRKLFSARGLDWAGIDAICRAAFPHHIFFSLPECFLEPDSHLNFFLILNGTKWVVAQQLRRHSPRQLHWHPFPHHSSNLSHTMSIPTRSGQPWPSRRPGTSQRRVPRPFRQCLGAPATRQAARRFQKVDCRACSTPTGSP